MNMIRRLKTAALLALALMLSLSALAEEPPVIPEADGEYVSSETALDGALSPVEDVDAEALETEADFGCADEDIPVEAEALPEDAAEVLPGEVEAVQLDAAQSVLSEQDAEPVREAAAPSEEVQAAEGESAPAEPPVEAGDALPEFTGNAKRVPVLTYHMVLTDDLKRSDRYAKDRYSVSVTAFDRQMAWLREKNYTAITCEQLYLWHQGQIRLPRRSVLITLDDGYASTIENIIPVLEKYGLRATEFVIGSASYEGKPGFVTYDRIRQIRAEHPCLEFQSHTWALHRKNAYTTERYAAFASDAAVQRDVYGFEYIAYPYGKNSRAMRRAYRNNGVKMAFLFGSSHDGYATRRQNLFKMKRIEIKSDMSMRKFRRWCK